VLHRKHFDLGVVRAAQGVRAVFAAGQEWDDACRLILSFVKANSAPKGQVSVSLGPRWCEATGEGKCEDSEGKGKEVGESEGEGKKRKRAGVKEKGGCEVKSRACEKVITRGEGSKMHAHTLSASPRSLVLNLDGVGGLRVDMICTPQTRHVWASVLLFLTRAIQAQFKSRHTRKHVL
jgi:hypothetical protein